MTKKQYKTLKRRIENTLKIDILNKNYTGIEKGFKQLFKLKEAKK